MHRYKTDGVQPPLPPVPCGAHLVTHLFEAGPASNTEFGAKPITWGELQSWQQQTGVRLQPWEARAVRRLSADYAAEVTEAKDPARPAPWSSMPTAEMRAALAKRIGAEMRAAAAAHRANKTGGTKP